MTTPYTIPHTAQNISDAITQVVNADSTPQSPSQNMVTSEGVKAYVDGAVTGLTTNSFAATTLVTESDAIGSNDNDTTIPTSAAVKDYVDTNKKSLATGFTQLADGGNASTSGTASSDGFIIAQGNGDSGTPIIRITIGSVAFRNSDFQGYNFNMCIPIASGETYSVELTDFNSGKIHFKALS